MVVVVRFITLCHGSLRYMVLYGSLYFVMVYYGSMLLYGSVCYGYNDSDSDDRANVEMITVAAMTVW